MSYALKTAAILASTAVLLCGSAMADPQAATLSRKVEMGDLDLSRQADVQVLFSRIDASARRICRSLYEGRTTQDIENVRACRAAALSRAAEDIKNERLTAMIDGRLRPGQARPTPPIATLADAGR
jgi:UrcA family protein